MQKSAKDEKQLDEITRLRRENDELKAKLKSMNENRFDDTLYSGFFENNSSIMLLIDPSTGDIIRANTTACTFYGYDKEQIRCMNLSQINILPHSELLEAISSSVNLTKNRFIFKHRLSNGDIRDVEVRNGPVELNGKIYLYSIVYDITGKNKTKTMLKQSEEKFKQLFNMVDDALFLSKLDQTGMPYKFIEVNAEACNRIGYSYEEMLQLSPLDIDINDEKEVLRQSSAVNNQGKIIFETVQKTRAGKQIPVEIRCHVFDWLGEKSLLAVARDITNRKKIEKDLRESLDKQRTILEFLPDAVFIVDRDEIVFANKYAVNLFGYSSYKELIGKPYLERVHPEHRDLCRKNFAYMESENKSCPLCERIFLKQDGSIIETEVTGVKIPYENHAAFLIVARDITERQKAKRELSEMIEYEKLRTEFFANISHELKTPLNVLMGSIQLLELLNGIEQSAGKANKYLKTMKQNCFRLLRLVNNIIDLSKVDSGYMNLNLGNHNIVNTVENITLSVADYIENRGMELIFDTDTEEKIIAFDADKLERILLNLISNSIKFTNQGGKIIVSLTDCADSVRISVKDTGIGIPEDKLKFIFERFIQVNKSLARNREGSGIGLALVKSLVDMHQGSINVSSTLGEGSEFIFEIPVRLVEETETGGNLLQDSHIERIKIEFSDIYD